MWKAARSTHPPVWKSVMLTIKELNIHAYKYLITILLQLILHEASVCKF